MCRFWGHGGQPFRSGGFIHRLPRVPSFGSGPPRPGVRFLLDGSVRRWLSGVGAGGAIFQGDFLLPGAAMAVGCFQLRGFGPRRGLLGAFCPVAGLLLRLLAVPREVRHVALRGSVARPGFFVAPHPRVVPGGGHPPRSRRAPAGEGAWGSRGAVGALVPRGLARPLAGPVGVSLGRAPKPREGGKKYHKGAANKPRGAAAPGKPSPRCSNPNTQEQKVKAWGQNEFLLPGTSPVAPHEG